MHPYGNGVQKNRTTYLFPDLKGVDEYRDPVEPTLLSADFTAVFLEVARLLNPLLEKKLYSMTSLRITISSCETKAKTFNFHMMERSMEEAVSTFQSVVEADQRNGGPQKKLPQAEN